MNQNVAKDEESRLETAGDRISRFLKKPGIENAFREMVRKEIEGALSKDDKRYLFLKLELNNEI